MSSCAKYDCALRWPCATSSTMTLARANMAGTSCRTVAAPAGSNNVSVVAIGADGSFDLVLADKYDLSPYFFVVSGTVTPASAPDKALDGGT